MAKAPIFGQDRLGIWGISDVMHSMPAQGSTTHLFGHVTKPMCTHIFCKRSGHTTPCKDHTTASSTTHNHNRLGLVPFSLPPRIVFDSLPRLAIGLVELLLNLLHTVAAGHQHPGDDEGIGLLPAGLELLPGLFSQLLIPRVALVVAPVEGLARPENLAVQRQGLAAGRAGLEVLGCCLGGAGCDDGGGHVAMAGAATLRQAAAAICADHLG